MDALSRLLMLNAPQGTIDKNCVLGSDWQLPHGAGELSVIRWHALTQERRSWKCRRERFYITPGKCGPATTKFSSSPEPCR